MSSPPPVTSTATTCPYCGVGCGVVVQRPETGARTVKGDPNHPANRGRLCSKGSALAETLGLEGRLLAPRIFGRQADWDSALDAVANGIRAAIDEHGPESVGFYVSGQLLTEDYYVANKLMKGFIGTANIDTNSRLCMASTVAGHRRAFGADTVPGCYEDLELADLVVLVGSNLAWCHPVLYQRLAAAKADRPGMKVVLIDPRRTATNDIADQHLPVAFGSDVSLFNGLLRHISDTGGFDAVFAEAHVSGLAETVSCAGEYTIERVANDTGLSPTAIGSFFELWARTEKVVTVFSQGVNQSAGGTDKVNAIINCHLATGRIGRAGTGPFSVTGQPNAMGGREVGGLSNMLACHMEIENAAHRRAVREFWRSPTICARPGLKAVDMFDAVRDGRVKALWIMSTNPATTMPDAGVVRDAIAACPFVVVSDIVDDTDTTNVADVLLPAAAWGEKSGTVTNSERTISRQRPFAEPPGLARPDWRIICDVAARMGWADHFDYDGPAAIFREHARLSGIARGFGLDFDISALGDLADEDYEAMAPQQWPVVPGGAKSRFFADGRFFTDNGRARMVPVSVPNANGAANSSYPLRLNTGRVRDHWHTMTRTGLSPRLSQHLAEPFAEIHPDDAARFEIAPADLVAVSNADASIVVRALITDRTPKGSVFVPIHWNGRWAANAKVGGLAPSLVDPHSGQPELKGGAVTIRRFDAAFYGFAACAGPIKPDAPYWAVARTSKGWRAELADTQMPSDWVVYARGLLGLEAGEAVSQMDAARGIARVAIVQDGVVKGVLFADREPVAVARAHVLDLIGEEIRPEDVLAGRPSDHRGDPGAMICSCFGVGANTILAAIAEQCLLTVEDIGRALAAGTNCGSCRPELKQLLSAGGRLEAAE